MPMDVDSRDVLWNSPTTKRKNCAGVGNAKPAKQNGEAKPKPRRKRLIKAAAAAKPEVMHASCFQYGMLRFTASL